MAFKIKQKKVRKKLTQKQFQDKVLAYLKDISGSMERRY
jgi:hypothetical protein